MRSPWQEKPKYYSPRAMRNGVRMMDALTVLRARKRGDCECDLDYQCPPCEKIERIAMRYACWKEKKRIKK